MTVVPTPSSATVTVSKRVDGRLVPVIGTNNVFDLEAGDLVTASVKAEGYQDGTRTETLNTSATWNISLDYLPLTIYFDNADAANENTLEERTFLMEAGGTDQGGQDPTEEPGNNQQTPSTDIDDGDGTISGRIQSNTSGIGAGEIEAK